MNLKIVNAYRIYKVSRHCFLPTPGNLIYKAIMHIANIASKRIVPFLELTLFLKYLLGKIY